MSLWQARPSLIFLTHVEFTNVDAWEVLKRCVLNAFNFLSQHLDGAFVDGDA